MSTGYLTKHVAHTRYMEACKASGSCLGELGAVGDGTLDLDRHSKLNYYYYYYYCVGGRGREPS